MVQAELFAVDDYIISLDVALLQVLLEFHRPIILFQLLTLLVNGIVDLLDLSDDKVVRHIAFLVAADLLAQTLFLGRHRLQRRFGSAVIDLHLISRLLRLFTIRLGRHDLTDVVLLGAVIDGQTWFAEDVRFDGARVSEAEVWIVVCIFKSGILIMVRKEAVF